MGTCIDTFATPRMSASLICRRRNWSEPSARRWTMATMQSLAGFARIVGSVGNPSKMPGTAYGISAYHCITGGKLAQVKGSICEDCYAVKGNYTGTTVKRAHADRERSLRNLPLWTETMAKYLAFLHGPKGPAKGKSGNPINKGWHRW